MSTEAFRERQGVLTSDEFASIISEHSRQKDHHIRMGYRSLFKTVLGLPNWESHPQKHWASYQEQDIEFVDIGHEDLKSISSSGGKFPGSVQRTFGFNPPIRFAVFDTRDDRSEAHKGAHNHSTSMVIESPHGETFRKKIVLHFGYEYSTKATDWYKKWVDYVTFGFTNENVQRLERASETDLLLVANGLAKLCAERLEPQETQTRP